MSNTTYTGATGPGPAPAEPTLQDRAGEVAGATREQAEAVATTAKEQASEVASTAAEQARVVAGDARQQARQLVEDSRRQLRDQAGEQANRAASSLRDLGTQLSRMASGQGAPEGTVHDLATQAAQGLSQFADSLQAKRPEELLADVRRFARQRPGAFVLGALGAGFVAGRLFRAADTDSVKEAVKEGMQGDSGGSQHELVTGQGAIGAVPQQPQQPPIAASTAAHIAAPQPGPPLGHAPRTEPLRAGDAEPGLGS